MVARLLIEGMSCRRCQQRVQKVIIETQGVEAATVDFGSGEAEVDFGRPTTVKQIIEAIEDAGCVASEI